MSSTTHQRYRAQADFALARVAAYLQRGDQQRAAEYHQAWSLALDAAEAENLERGGGARVLRRRSPPANLRPLPQLPEVTAPTAPAPAPAPPPPDPVTLPAYQVGRALLRQRRIDAALRGPGFNPYPDEIPQTEWSVYLAAFEYGGPCECEVLAQAEDAVDTLMEENPDLDDAEIDAWVQHLKTRKSGAAPDPALVAAHVQYLQGLAHLSDEDLERDLDALRFGGSEALAALVTEELHRRERGQ